jgi:hypothetical protein
MINTTASSKCKHDEYRNNKNLSKKSKNKGCYRKKYNVYYKNLCNETDKIIMKLKNIDNDLDNVNKNDLVSYEVRLAYYVINMNFYHYAKNNIPIGTCKCVQYDHVHIDKIKMKKFCDIGSTDTYIYSLCKYETIFIDQKIKRAVCTKCTCKKKVRIKNNDKYLSFTTNEDAKKIIKKSIDSYNKIKKFL